MGRRVPTHMLCLDCILEDTQACGFVIFPKTKYHSPCQSNSTIMLMITGPTAIFNQSVPNVQTWIDCTRSGTQQWSIFWQSQGCAPRIRPLWTDYQSWTLLQCSDVSKEDHSAETTLNKSHFMLHTRHVWPCQHNLFSIITKPMLVLWLSQCVIRCNLIISSSVLQVLHCSKKETWKEDQSKLK